MLEQYTKKAREVIFYAKEASSKLNHGYVGTEHLLLGILIEGTSAAAKILTSFQLTVNSFMRSIEEYIGEISKTPVEGDFSPRTNACLERAIEIAKRHDMELVSTQALFLAIIEDGDCVGTKLLKTMKVDIRRAFIEAYRSMGMDNKEIQEEIERMRSDREQGDNQETPTLDRFSSDLTQKASDGELDPVVGREDEITRLIQILCRRTKNNPCLIGEPGVGKTAIVEALAKRISDGLVPEQMKNKTLLTLDLPAMVAGTKYRGEFEERMKTVIDEVTQNKEIILFLDELHTLIGAGGAEGSMDASNILKPSLARGELQIIGATTIDEYRKHIEKDPALERRFQPIMVEEPTKEESIEILKGIRPAFEAHHKVIITDTALEAAVTLSARYINDRFLPDKAIDLMDEAAAKARITGNSIDNPRKKIEDDIAKLEEKRDLLLAEGQLSKAKATYTRLLKKQKALEEYDAPDADNKCVVDKEQIAAVVAAWTKIPVVAIKTDELKRLKDLESILHKRVIGQDEAVTVVSKAIRRGRVGLKNPKRPIGSFLFLGPTGVGKTELSKALAEALFGTESALIRVDMTEYMEKHSVSKLIGSPPGYVGFEEGGQLSEKVRRNPYAVILFDEIEKAHPDVFNILLQVLDDGQITDSQGRKIDFRNTVIIMTSNCGAMNIMTPKKLGFGIASDAKADHEYMKQRVMEDVKQQFKPEFINRIDDMIVFHSLQKEHMNAIVEIMIAELKERISSQLKMKFTMTDAAKAYLADKGFDPKFGARPLRRAIQNLVEDPLAEAILSGEYKEGSQIIADYAEEKIVFSKKLGGKRDGSSKRVDQSRE